MGVQHHCAVSGNGHGSQQSNKLANLTAVDLVAGKDVGR
jgi:hypothetical protein